MKNCPANGQRCRRYGGRNHFGRVCKSQWSTVNLVDEPEADAEYFLDAATINVQGKRNARTVDLQFYGKLLQFKIDTGADVTILYYIVNTFRRFRNYRTRCRSLRWIFLTTTMTLDRPLQNRARVPHLMLPIGMFRDMVAL